MRNHKLLKKDTWISKEEGVENGIEKRTEKRRGKRRQEGRGGKGRRGTEIKDKGKENVDKIIFILFYLPTLQLNCL